MILFDEQDTVTLSSFGMQIPVHHSKAAGTLAFLREHPALGPVAHLWEARTRPMDISRHDLELAHAPEYVDRLFSQELEHEVLKTYELIAEDGSYHRYDPARAERPLSDVLQRALARVAGTVQCCRKALQVGFCFYMGGGMHHGHWDHGKGFCLLNDIVIALRKLQQDREISSAWVIDVDAHKGDGTAALTRDDPSIVTLSVHMARGWPLDEPDMLENSGPNPSLVPSDIDMPIGPGEEGRYLERLQTGLKTLTTFPRPDLALVVSGADPYELDELESTAELKLSLEQLLARDVLIWRFLQAQNVPQACLMAGGYGSQTWRVYAQFLEQVLLERTGGLNSSGTLDRGGS